MGLDNGIVVYKRNKPAPDEVCYWRKCWGIRNEILDVVAPDRLNMSSFNWDCDRGYSLSAEDIAAIIKVLDRFNNKKYWDEYSDSIFGYDEFESTLERQMLALIELLDELNTPNNDIQQIEFYDSY